MTTTPTVTRQPRSESRLRGLDEIEQRHEDEIPGDKSGEGGDGQPTPEEALAEATRITAERDRLEAENRALLARATAAEDAAKQANKTVTDTAAARIADQEAAIKGAVSTAQAKRDAAQTKYREARANNDADGEAAALADLTTAGAELVQAQATERSFTNWKENRAKNPPPQPRQEAQKDQQQPAAGDLTPETRAWLGSHPLYYKDEDYRANAQALSDTAISQRLPEGSQPYIDFVDKGLEKIYGKNHGQITPKGGKQMSQPQNQNRRSSMAAPTRGGDGGGGNRGGGDSFEYRDPTTGDTLRLVSGIDDKGKTFETVQGTIPAQWREFARVNRMTDVAYAVEQLKIHKDMEPGGEYEGLAYHQNGVYRA